MNIEGQHITILGAGLTGSLLAVLLSQRDMRVTLIERQADPRLHTAAAGRSINLAMAARGLRALTRAGLADGISDLMCPMPGRMLHQIDGRTEFQPYSSNPDEVNFSVSRAGLNHRLLDAAEASGAELRFQQRCDDYDAASHTLLLTDLRGGEHQYQLRVERFIAADGAGSPVRRALQNVAGFEMREELLGHRYQEIDIPADDNGGYRMAPEALHVWPRGGYMLIALPNPEGDFTATLFMPEKSDDGSPSFEIWDDPAQAVDFITEQFPDIPPLVADLGEQVSKHPLGIMGTVHCNRWHHGDRCLLIGDAAHAIVPFHGQGMNAAFEDCVVLDQLLDEQQDWAGVFASFTEHRLANAEAIATMAMENYVEMRDTVRDPRFHLKKALAFALERNVPEYFVPRYSMVMFHADIPYAVALERGRTQAALLDRWTRQADRLDDIDIQRCIDELKEMLAPLY